MFTRILILVISISIASLMATAVNAIDLPGTYAPADSLATGRSDHTATYLADGRIFIAGGTAGVGAPLDSTELYDPVSGTITAGPSLSAARATHTATLLPDGRVLLAGGFTSGIVALTSAEIFDPATDTISAAADMSTARMSHSATLLDDGRVLVAGGFTGTAVTASAELFDGAAWTATGSLNEAREAHTATLLLDGRVLITAGQGTFPVLRDSAELYDPLAGAFAFTGSVSTARWWHTATLLPDGAVIVAGGNTDFNTGAPTGSVERFDPVGGTFTSVGSLSDTMAQHTAALLTDGTILMFGGGAAAPERWNPATDGTELGGVPGVPERSAHTATITADRSVAIIGGFTTGSSPIASIELYTSGGEAGVPGGSIVLPADTVLGRTVISVTFILGGSDVRQLSTIAGVSLMVPIGVVADLSDSLAAVAALFSVTLIEDTSSLATAAPPPPGGVFVDATAIVFDAFINGVPSGPFDEPAVLSLIAAITFDLSSSGVYIFEPEGLSVVQTAADVPWVEIDPALVVIDGQTITWPVEGPGLYAVISFPADGDEQPPATLQLATAASANFWIWAAGEISAVDLFEGSDTLITAWRWNGAGWDAFNPSLPVAVTTNFTLGAGPEPDILWLVTSGPLAVDAAPGGPPVPDEPVLLAEGAGAGFALWRGAATTAAELFENVATVTVVWRWNGVGWDAFNPTLPSAVTTNFALGEGAQPDLLWLVSSGLVEVSLGG